MENFDFVCPTKIIFGKETEIRVGEEVKKYSNKIMLIYGGGSIKRTGLYDKVINSLRENHIEYIELSGVKP
jgi:Iron-containing alcohol dehydrogenase.